MLLDRNIRISYHTVRSKKRQQRFAKGEPGDYPSANLAPITFSSHFGAAFH